MAALSFGGVRVRLPVLNQGLDFVTVDGRIDHEAIDSATAQRASLMRRRFIDAGGSWAGSFDWRDEARRDLIKQAREECVLYAIRGAGESHDNDNDDGSDLAAKLDAVRFVMGKEQ